MTTEETGRGHTPGPWRVFLTRDGRSVIGVGDRDGGGITDQGDVSTNNQGVWRSGSEKSANARLIAAAPELLEALLAIVNGPGLECIPDADVQVAIKAAIRKATEVSQ